MHQKMKQISNFKALIFITLLSLLHYSCDRDVNDWPVENIENRLFKPLLFESSALKATSIQIKHTKVINASKYIFEFSKNNFESTDKEVVILADTLSIFADSNSPMKVEYRTLFDGLDGTSHYWVRMYAENADGTLKSHYNTFEFTTPAEQLFKTYSASANAITLNWPANAEVTNIVFKQGDNILEDHTLSATEKSSGQAIFSGLSMGTSYTAIIQNGDVLRGEQSVKTTGIAGSSIYKVKKVDNYESISSGIKDLVTGGSLDITVEFEPGTTYNIDGVVTIPAGTKNISFIGSVDTSGLYPVLSNGNYTIEGTVEDITFQNLEMTGNGGMLLDIGGQVFKDILFLNCKISKLNSIVRLYSGAVGNSINITNCKISETGGWGMLNVGSGNTIGSINVTNCTLTEISTRFADVRVKTDINFKNCTLCNTNAVMTHLWLLDNASKPSVSIQNCILSGTNGGIKLHSTNGNYSNITITYGGCYKTNDLIEDSRPLTDITEVPLSMTGLFVDPLNGDFHIKPGAGFAGTGVAGDSRWFD